MRSVLPRNTAPSRPALAVGLALAIAAVPAPAPAQIRVALDAQLARPLSRPQMDAFGLGGGGGITVEWSPRPSLGLLARVQSLALSPYEGALPEGYAHPGTGTLSSLAVGARVRPLGWLFGVPGDGLWLEAAVGGGLTGTTVRPVASARAGVAVRLGSFALGPYAGYTRVFEWPDSLLPGDAQLAVLGLEASFAPLAPRVVRPRAAQPLPAPGHCPPALRVTRGDADGDRCPDSDRDGDTLADMRDRCPDTGEDFDGFADADGCPEPDNDADAIADVFDACPDVPEVINGVDDEDGCPDEAPVQVVRGRIQHGDVVLFAFASARVREPARPIVRALARLLAVHPEYRTVYIEGHADEIGDDHFNYNLSFQRALAVAELLAEFGVARERLVPLGFGRTAPVDTSHSPAARARNRRVEFVVDGHRSAGRARAAHGWIDVPREEAP
jgi:outer membrane protein OmpA-like peptidoglycan-associated protein